MARKRRHLVLALAALALVCAGCGSGGLERNDLRGTVTWNGQPVPKGTIYFDPDSSKGNEGPQGVGLILNGTYRTNPGFGAVSGPHKVRITGYDGVVFKLPSGQPMPDGKALFINYEVETTIEKGTRTLDFAVPLQQKHDE